MFQELLQNNVSKYIRNTIFILLVVDTILNSYIPTYVWEHVQLMISLQFINNVHMPFELFLSYTISKIHKILWIVLIMGWIFYFKNQFRLSFWTAF